MGDPIEKKTLEAETCFSLKITLSAVDYYVIQGESPFFTFYGKVG